MAIDSKYGQIEFPKGDIGNDEPIFVFRAQDAMVPQVLKFYRDLCEHAGSPRTHLDKIESSAAEIRQWQANNKVQIPMSQGE